MTEGEAAEEYGNSSDDAVEEIECANGAHAYKIEK
jgi:hypothetical protein